MTKYLTCIKSGGAPRFMFDVPVLLSIIFIPTAECNIIAFTSTPLGVNVLQN